MNKFSITLQHFETSRKIRVVAVAPTGDDALHIAKEHLPDPYNWFMVRCVDHDEYENSYTDMATLTIPEAKRA